MDSKVFRKFICGLTLAAFVLTGLPAGFAQTILPSAVNQASVLPMPSPGAMVPLSAVNEPVLMAGLQMDGADPLKFNFLFDRGRQEMTPEARRVEYLRLVKYFLASLTTPNKDMWVNLSPYEHDRMIPDNFALTQMGRDLLAQDYLLKQVTASLLYPDSGPGKAFWTKVYQQAAALYGTTDIPLDTFNKVWILPDTATVYARQNSALIVENHLKVMLESDYLAMSTGTSQSAKTQADRGDPATPNPASIISNDIARKVLREIVIPLLEKEVNEGSNFVVLRQVYSAMLTAAWFKKSLKESLLGQVYADQNRVAGVELNDPLAREAIYQKYLQAFRQGVFNLVREDLDPMTGETLPRKYFSGGTAPYTDKLVKVVSSVRELTPVQNVKAAEKAKRLDRAEVALTPTDAAMKPLAFAQRLLGILRQGFRAKSTGMADQPTLNFGKDSGLPPERDIRLGKGAVEWRHPTLGLFSDLEHFVTAQDKITTTDGYAALMTAGQGPAAAGRLKALLDRLNGYDPTTASGTYTDPQLKDTIFQQSGLPRLRGITEAVSNGLDALYKFAGENFMRGQFSKGVKQILTWLEANGEDRLEVYTRMAGAPAYKLTIIRALQGTFFIQVKTLNDQEFRSHTTVIAGKELTHGTVVQVTVRQLIPRRDIDLKGEPYSLEGLARGIHHATGNIRDFKVLLSVDGEKDQKVNGFVEIVAPEERVLQGDGVTEGSVRIVLNAGWLAIADDGIGMNARLISRMIAPGKGDKAPETINPGSAEEQRELKRISAGFKTESVATTVAFGRRGESVLTVDLPVDVHPDALRRDLGGMMVDLGLLLPVRESRGAFNLTPAFARGINRLVEKILADRKIEDTDKVRYLNAIVFGLEGIDPGNMFNRDPVERLILDIRQQAAGLIEELERMGRVALPHYRAMGGIKLPQGKTAVYVHAKILPAVHDDLGKVGAKRIPGFWAGGEKMLPVLVVPFKTEALEGVRRLDLGRFAAGVPAEMRVPLVKTEHYIAVPQEAGERLRVLSGKSDRSPAEEREWQVYVQMFQIVTPDEVKTHYEALSRHAQELRLESPTASPTAGYTERLAMLLGEASAEADAVPDHLGIPAGATMKMALLVDGTVVEAGTGRKIPMPGPVKALEPLMNGYYRIDLMSGIVMIKHLSKRSPDFDEIPDSWQNRSSDIKVSPDKRLVFVIKQDFLVCWIDLRSGKTIYPAGYYPSGIDAVTFIHFDRRGKRFLYEWRDPQTKEGGFKIINIDTMAPEMFASADGQMTEEWPLASGQGVFQVPFADAFMLSPEWGEGSVFDYSRGWIGNADFVRASSDGRYSVLKVSPDEMLIYDHQQGVKIAPGTIDALARDDQIKEVIFGYLKDRRLKILVKTKNNPGWRQLNEGTAGQYALEPVDADVLELAKARQDGQIIDTAIVKNNEVLYWKESHGFNHQVLLFKHPVFDLLINASRSDRHEAMEPLTQQEVAFSGDILGYNSEYLFWRDGNGKSYQSTWSDPLSDEKKEGRSAPFRVEEMGESVDAGPEHFLEISSVDQGYLLMVRDGLIPVPLMVDRDRYPRVIYDGQFLVFTNPRNGDTVYVDPKSPEVIHAVPITASVPGTAAVPAAGGFLPANELPGAIRPLQVRSNPERPDRPHWEWQSADADGKTWNITAYEGEYFIFNSDRVHESGHILDMKNELVLLQDGLKEINLFCLKPGAVWGRKIPKDEKVTLSASGRYLLYEDQDQNYGFHRAGAKDLEYLGSLEGQALEARVLEQADVVIFKMRDGTYSLYDFADPARAVVKGAEHIEVDSTGKVAVVKMPGNKLGWVDLSAHQREPVIRYSMNGRLLVLMEGNGPGMVFDGPKSVTSVSVDSNEFVGRFLASSDKPSALYTDGNGIRQLQSDGRLARVGEVYDLEGKNIWVGIEQVSYIPKALYRENGPTAADRNEMQVAGDMVIDQHGQQLYDYSVGERNVHFAQDSRPRAIKALKGNKVVYSLSSKGGYEIDMVRTHTRLEEDIIDRGFVTSGNKYLVVVEKVTGRVILIDENEKEKEIHGPAGARLAGVYGDYFVFTDTNEYNVWFLDPLKALTAEDWPAAASLEAPKVSPDEQRWNDVVKTRLDGWLSQERRMMDEIKALMPPEAASLVEEAVARLEDEQDQGIRVRFKANEELEHLPFDRVEARWARVAPVLGKYLAGLAGRGLERDIYVAAVKDLTRRLLPYVMEGTLEEVGVDELFFDALALGWDISLQSGLAAAAPGAPETTPSTLRRLLSVLKEKGTGMARQRKIVSFLGKFIARAPQTNQPLVEARLSMIMEKTAPDGMSYLERLVGAFDAPGVTDEALGRFLADPGFNAFQLGPARAFAIFLTSPNARMVHSRKEDVPAHGENLLPVSSSLEGKAGISQTQAVQIWKSMMKGEENAPVMSVEAFTAAVRRGLPPLTEDDRKAELRVAYDRKNQGEDGAHAREGAANARDSMRQNGLAGVLEMRYYVTEGAHARAVEEYRDTAGGAVYPMTMALPVSSKREGGQVETTGNFGAGNQTFFRDADDLVRYTSDGNEAWMFSWRREPSDGIIYLTGIYRVKDEEIPRFFGERRRGVIVRKGKTLEHGIPEIDARMAEDALLGFSGMSQGKGINKDGKPWSFGIMVEGENGQLKPLVVDTRVIGEAELVLPAGADQTAADRGARRVRVWQTRGLPTQIIDADGFRVQDIPKELLEYIPPELQSHVAELGLVIQVPLKVTRGRDEFEGYEQLRPAIAQAVTVAFYRALAFKTLTQSRPQFNFMGYSTDLDRTVDDMRYDDAVFQDDPESFQLAKLINEGQVAGVSGEAFARLAAPSGGVAKVRRYVNLIQLLRVATDPAKPEVLVSLMDRRLAVQDRVMPLTARERARERDRNGYGESAFDPQTDPDFEIKVFTGLVVVEAHKQMEDPAKFVIPPEKLTAEQKKLAQLAGVMAAVVGVEQIRLMEEGARFAGSFKMHEGKKTMFLAAGLANKPFDPKARGGFFDETTDTIIHELTHMTEHLIAANDIDLAWDHGYVAPAHDDEGRTHQARGKFQEIMQYLTMVIAHHWHQHGIEAPVVVAPLMALLAEPEKSISLSQLSAPADAAGTEELATHVAAPALQKDILKGGIDLNDENLNWRILRDNSGAPLPLAFQDPALSMISGFTPAILEIAPADRVSFPFLLDLHR